MPDYNIYIHSINGNGSSNKTDPNNFKPTNTSAEEDDDSLSFKEGFSLLTKAANGGLSGAVGAAAKAIAPVAIAVAAVKLVDKSINAIEPFISQSSGDYRFNVGYNNVKSVVHNLSHPLSYGWERLHIEFNYALAERRNEQSRVLLGDSVINEEGWKL